MACSSENDDVVDLPCCSHTAELRLTHSGTVQTTEVPAPYRLLRFSCKTEPSKVGRAAPGSKEPFRGFLTLQPQPQACLQNPGHGLEHTIVIPLRCWTPNVDPDLKHSFDDEVHLSAKVVLPEDIVPCPIELHRPSTSLQNSMYTNTGTLS